MSKSKSEKLSSTTAKDTDQSTSMFRAGQVKRDKEGKLYLQPQPEPQQTRPLITTLVKLGFYINPKEPDKLIHKYITSENFTSILVNHFGEKLATRFKKKLGSYSAKLNIFEFKVDEIELYRKISKIHFREQELRRKAGGVRSSKNEKKWKEISFLEKLQNVLLENPDAKGEELRGLIQNYRNPNYSGTQISETNQNPQIFARFFSHCTRDLIREDWPELLETTLSSSK